MGMWAQPCTTLVIIFSVHLVSIQLVLVCLPSVSALSTMSVATPRGCAAIPFQKKKVAVFGAGGYLGANVFGFLQRAASLYGTGIGGGASIPRCICATGTGSGSLNRVLSRNFKLAFAGENMVALTNVQDIEAIRRSLSDIDAVVLATNYQLDIRPVTSNTYERTPNDKTYEFYLDERRGRDSEKESEAEFNAALFRDSCRACKLSGVQHVVVLESPGTIAECASYLSVLDKEGLDFSYIRVEGDMDSCQGYNFEKGLQGNLDIRSFPISSQVKRTDEYFDGEWIQKLTNKVIATKGSQSIAIEDIAAVAVQSLLSLDWTESRVICVGAEQGAGAGIVTESGKDANIRTTSSGSDREWCQNSKLLAEKMALIQ